MTTEQHVNAKNLIKLTDVPGGELDGTWAAPTVDNTHSAAINAHHAQSHTHVSHTGIGVDDHHAQLHRAAHESVGADRIGQGVVLFDNDVDLSWKDVGGVTRHGLDLHSTNVWDVGSGNYPVRLQGNGDLRDYDGVSDFQIISKNRLRYAIKAADEIVNNSITLQNDDVLTIAVPANATFRFIARIRFNSSAVADFKYAFTVPAGASMRANGAQSDITVPASEGNLTTVMAVASAAWDQAIMLFGHIIVGATAGSVTLQWAQNALEVSDTKVLAGSFLELLRV